MTYFPNIAIDTNNVTGDAFGRLRVSEPDKLFASKQVFDNQPLFWDDSEVSGSGTTSAHSAADARTRIGVSGATAGKRIRQTFMRFNYQPGKSQFILMTGVLQAEGAGQSGLVRGFGYGDDNNGIFLLDDEGTIKLQVYKNGSVAEEVNQSNWNSDTLDGNGPSGITIDFTKTQILEIDFEWLGVGRVRVGFNIDGVEIIAHKFDHANSLTSVYMSTPNLPLRYWVENDGTAGAATLDHICCSVMSEGGEQKLGSLLTSSTGATAISANTVGTIYPVVGLRLKSTNIGSDISLVDISLAETAGNKVTEWMVLLNPTVTGTFTYAAVTNSSAEVAIGSTATATGGTQTGGGFFSSSNRGGATGSVLTNAIKLGASIAGAVDEMVLCVRPVDGTNQRIHGSITYRESP